MCAIKVRCKSMSPSHFLSSLVAKFLFSLCFPLVKVHSSKELTSHSTLSIAPILVFPPHRMLLVSFLFLDVISFGY